MAVGRACSEATPAAARPSAEEGTGTRRPGRRPPSSLPPLLLRRFGLSVRRRQVWGSPLRCCSALLSAPLCSSDRISFKGNEPKLNTYLRNFYWLKLQTVFCNYFSALSYLALCLDVVLVFSLPELEWLWNILKWEIESSDDQSKGSTVESEQRSFLCAFQSAKQQGPLSDLQRKEYNGSICVRTCTTEALRRTPEVNTALQIDCAPIRSK